MVVMARWFLWLMIYSFIGWVYESTVCSVGQRKLVNRGFLNGPVCPVYGFGAIVSILFLYGRTNDILLLFLAGTVLTCTVEYITSVLLEKLFHARWWDYSHHRFHINGRVSLLGAVVFGTLSVLLIKIIHPLVVGLTERIPETTLIIFSSAIFFMIAVDLFLTVRHLLSLNNRLQEIQVAINNYLEEQAKRAEEVRNAILDKFEESGFYNERIQSLMDKSRLQNARLMKAFPKLRSIKYADALQKIKNIILRQKDSDVRHKNAEDSPDHHHFN